MGTEEMCANQVLINPDIENGKYQDVAIFVDQPLFLQLLTSLRTQLSLKEPLGNVGLVRETLLFPTYSEMKELFTEWIFKIHDLINQDQTKSNTPSGLRFLEIVPKIIRDLKYPPYFRDILWQAVIFGLVGHYPPAAEITGEQKERPLFDESLVTITPTHRTTKKEMLKVLRQTKDYFEQNIELAIPNSSDTITNIKMYRDWYWKRMNGKTYKQISDEWVEKHVEENTIDLDVIKAVQIYKRLLSSQSRPSLQTQYTF